jgi:hypothetical protein
LALFGSGTAPRGHDLGTLFRALSPDLRLRIVAETGHPESFDADLEIVHDVFEVWRYVYERHSVDTDLGFLQRLAAAVQKALTAVP